MNPRPVPTFRQKFGHYKNQTKSRSQRIDDWLEQNPTATLADALNACPALEDDK
jgi:hypothetical protein